MNRGNDMKNENNSPEDIEKRLQNYFQKKSEDLQAPSNLWTKLESRMDESKKQNASNNRLRNWLNSWVHGPRLVGVAASTAAVLLLLVTSLVWLTADNGNTTESNRTHGIATTNGVFEQDGTVITATIDGNDRVPTEGNDSENLTISPSSGAIGSQQGFSGVTVNPLPAGSTPTSTIDASGKLILGIPKGADGDTGATGPAGPAGTLGIDGTNSLDGSGRQIISSATISLQVQNIDATISQIQGITDSLGGMMEQMSSTGGQDAEQASVTIRVPQDQFFTAFDKLKALGDVQSQNLGSQDVTEQFIDLEARLKSAQQEEQSLLSLLNQTKTVGEVITLENELSQVRSKIESIQGQLNYLARRVDLATISISLSTPSKLVGQPPSGSLTVAVHDVASNVATVKGLVSSVNGELGEVNISENNGKEMASVYFNVYRADFDGVVASIEKQGKTEQKYIDEGVTPKAEQTQTAGKPDASVRLTLVEDETHHGFWTAGNIAIISVAGGVILAALLIFLLLANRAGLLKKQSA